MELPQDYEPSLIQQTQNTLYANHFKFEIERLPDLSFFVQSASIPSVSTGLALQTNPFSTIHHPGDRLSYGTFEVTYLIDAKLEKTRATMRVLLPDTSAIVAEVLMEEVFPYEMSAVQFTSTDADAPVLTTTCTFSCSSFEVKTYL